MFEYGATEVTVKARDRLADLVIRRHREAVSWQASEHVGGKSLRTVLRECYEQANGMMSPEDFEIAEALGVNAYVGLTAMKGGVVQAFLMESLVAADGLPWSVKPTPVPELSGDARTEALNMVKAELLGAASYTGDILELMREIKERMLRKQSESAEQAALRMERLMYDQCAEGSWQSAMSGFLHDFVFYPFGVILGPVPTRRPRLAWTGNRVRPRMETFYRWESVSPWDFWYSPDSRSAQDGTCVFVRKRLTRRHLLEMREMKSYLGDQVDAVLREAESEEYYNFRWLSANPDQPDNRLSAWADCSETVDMLVHYGLVSGNELSEYGIGGLERGRFYEATISVVGGYTVQVFVAPDPSVDIRPVFTSSFYRTRDRIANFGISQRMRSVERAYMTAFRYMIRNMANASEPIVEADYPRISKHMADDDLMQFNPGSVYLTDGDPMSSQVPALRFYNIPNAVPQFANVLGYFMDLAHTVTNIPASLHGTAEGTGANRTFRGMANLQSNAVKSLQAAVANVDETVFGPMGELLFAYNMLYEDDPSIKGDSKVMAQGVQGLLAREMERNSALELLQLLGAIAAQLGPSASPLLDWSIRRVLVSMRVPPDIASQVKFGQQAPALPGPAPPAGPGDLMPAAGPGMPPEPAAGGGPEPPSASMPPPGYTQ
jgi:hypothetical protein